MILDVRSTAVSPWLVSNGVFLKRVELETSVGSRRHDIAFAFESDADGTVLGSLTLSFNFSLMPPNDVDGKWVLVGLKSGDIKGGHGGFQCVEKFAQSSLVTRNREDITRFIDSLITDRDWMVQILGSEGVVFEFPLPADPTFNGQIVSFMRKVGKSDA